MPRFFIPKEQICEDTATVVGDDLFHMGHTLRMKVGEEVTLCDEEGIEYDCVIREMDKEKALLTIRGRCQSANEPTLEACLFQCVPKGDKMETIVQKAVELGVSRIVPVLSRNCVVKLDAKNGAKKAERWNKIALSAAKQCGRGKVPVVENPISYEAALEEMAHYTTRVLFYEHARDGSLRDILKKEDRQLAFLIGSEGGLTPQEVEQAAERGVKIATLGKRILRTETASGAVLAVAMYETGNLE